MSTRSIHPWLASLAILLGAMPAVAANREGVNFQNVPSDGSAQVRTTNLVGGYTARSLLLTGTLTLVAGGTRPSEVVIDVQPPGAAAFRVRPFSDYTLGTSASSTMRTLSRWVVRIPTAAAAAGTWTFRFSDTLDQPGIDARWDSITIQLNDGPPPSAINLGTLGIGHTQATAPAASQVSWFTFRLAVDASASTSRYFAAAAETLTAGVDAAIAIYDADGRLVRWDDDDGIGLEPVLTLGAPVPGRLIISDALALDGRDGPLPAGQYYLAVASGPAVFQSGFAASVAGSATAGLFRLHMNTNAGLVPTPPRPPVTLQRR